MNIDFSNKKKQSSNKIDCDEISTHHNLIEQFVKYNFPNFSVNNYLIILGNKSNKGIEYFNKIFQKNYPEKTLIAYDIFGGLFALNQSNSDVIYFAPDSLEWELLNIDYDTFITWIFTEKINLFYEFYIPDNLEEYNLNIFDGDVISTYPFLWSDEYDRNTANRKVVKFQTLFHLNIDFVDSLNSI